MADVKIDAVAEVDDSVKGMEKLDKSLDKTDKRLDSVRDAFKQLDKEIKVLKKDVDGLNAPMRRAEQIGKNLRKGFMDAGKAVDGFLQSTRAVVATIAIAAAVIYGFGRALQWAGEQAERLGQRKAAESINGLVLQLKELGDQLLTLTLPGGSTVFELMAKGSEIAIQQLRILMGVIEASAAGYRQMVIDIQRAIGKLAEATGQTTEWTQAWQDNETQLNKALFRQRLALIATGQLTEAYEKLAMSNKSARQSNIRTGESLDSLIKKNKALNDTYNQRLAREEAIRAGDARALAAANAGLRGSTLDRSNARPNGPGAYANGGTGERKKFNGFGGKWDDSIYGGGGGNTGSNQPTIEVYVDNGAGFEKATKKAISKHLLKPIANAKKGGRKNIKGGR